MVWLFVAVIRCMLWCVRSFMHDIKTTDILN